jgi:hypothetical protein
MMKYSLRIYPLLALLIALAGSGVPVQAQPPAPVSAAESQHRIALPLILGSGGAGGASAQALIAAALKAGRIDYGTALIYRAYALFADDRLPADLWGNGSEGEDQSLFVQAAEPTLPINVQSQLRPFLLRPDHADSVHSTRRTQVAAASALPCDANNWAAQASSTPGVKIRVHTKCQGDYTADIDTTLGLIEGLWGPMTRHMGNPLPDAGGSDGGGSDDIDLYLLEPLGKIWRQSMTREITSTALAVTVAAAPYPGLRSSGYMLFSRKDLATSSFKSILAHEFFHVLQNAHNQKIQFQGTTEWWFTEASATWAQANFVPETSLPQVHVRFLDPFQHLDDSLHRSVDLAELDSEAKQQQQQQMYAAYIWPFFMEQELGEGAIADAWEALEEAGTGWERGIQAIDAQLPFNINFHRFALRNLNSDFDGENPLETRYVDLDPQFPDGKMPDTKVHDHLLARTAADAPLTYADSIPALEAHYYHFTVDEAVRQVIFDFSKLQSLLDRKIDAVVKIRGKPWEIWDQLPDQVRFCRDNPDQDLVEIWLVVSNHNTDIRTEVDGSLEVRALKESCSCDLELAAKVAAVQQWQGSVTFDYSAAGMDSHWRIQQQREANVAVTLDPQIEGPLSFIGSPTGAARVDDQAYMRDSKGEELFLAAVGAGPPVPYIQAENKFSRVTLNFSSSTCKYNWGASVYMKATMSSAGLPSKELEIDIGSMHSDWMPITSTLVLAGAAAFPAHSPDYILDHGPPFYEQADYDLVQILGEGNLGAATVTWRFTPVVPPAP